MSFWLFWLPSTEQQPVFKVIGSQVGLAVFQVCVTGIILILFARMFIPEEVRFPSVMTIYGDDIRYHLLKNIESTTYYAFQGRTGRWTRSIAIPKLAEEASHRGTSTKVELYLPDPEEETFIAEYAEYRNTIDKAADGKWSPDGAQNEILATVATAYFYRSKNALLDIEVIVSPGYPGFRINLTSEECILTREKPGQPALLMDKRSAAYGAMVENIKNARRIGRSVKLAEAHSVGKAVEDFLRAEFVSINLSDEKIADIMTRAKNTNKIY